MQKIYSIIVAMFALSLVTTAINDPFADGSGGIFDTHIHEVGLDIDAVNNSIAEISKVDDIGTPEKELSLFSLPGLLIKGIAFLAEVLWNTAVIYPMLLKYKVPMGIALIIQGMVTLVQSVGLVQFTTGRAFGGMK